MPLGSPSLLTEGVDGTNRSSGTSYTTASITPTANRLVHLVVWQSSTTTPVAPTISGNGLTWTLVDSETFQSAQYLLSVYRASGASPSTGAISIQVNHNTTQCLWKVFEVDGQDATTPVPQANSATGNSTTPEVALGAFGAVGNATVLAVGNGLGAAATMDPESGSWVEIGTPLFNNSPNGWVEVFWLAGNDTTPSATMTSGSWAAVAWEVAEDAGGGGGPTGFGRLLGHERNRLVRTF